LIDPEPAWMTAAGSCAGVFGFASHGFDFAPVQANVGFSVREGTVRGMHLQEAPAVEAKLVRCTRSHADVVLDLRPESPPMDSGTALN
jgi:dTDP-4-dehydrorhamnose 3,5-epimerase-like enzyme